MSDEQSALADFSGTARLFPLPNLVLFPHAMQPLHIFEPRYRQMTADALADDRLIALVLLRPGWEGDYQGKPSVSSVACLGRIIAEQRMPDGRFNILLRGLSRAFIDEELSQGKSYRQARVHLLDDTSLPDDPTARKLRRQLVKTVPAWFPGQKALLQQFRKLLRSDLSLSALSDIIAFALPLDLEIKQGLLEELGVEERGRQLLHHLELHQPAQVATPAERKFPPAFSLN